MGVWVTKYALSDGIEKMSAPVEGADGYVKDAFKKDHYITFKLGRDAFKSEEEAKADANKKRLAKIASLEKQIAKLKAMKF